ncbi:hypothetical protein ACFL2Q_15730, partial [Thermodesulfobacteriota bacterium]
SCGSSNAPRRSGKGSNTAIQRRCARSRYTTRRRELQRKRREKRNRQPRPDDHPVVADAVGVIGDRESDTNEAAEQLAMATLWCVQEERLTKAEASESTASAFDTLIAAGLVFDALGRLWKQTESVGGLWSVVYCFGEHDTRKAALRVIRAAEDTNCTEDLRVVVEITHAAGWRVWNDKHPEGDGWYLGRHE